MNKWNFLSVCAVCFTILAWELLTAGTPDISEFKDVGGGSLLGLALVGAVKYLIGRNKTP
jgi:hypothetical protein